jgi:hypothetical protein
MFFSSSAARRRASDALHQKAILEQERFDRLFGSLERINVAFSEAYAELSLEGEADLRYSREPLTLYEVDVLDCAFVLYKLCPQLNSRLIMFSLPLRGAGGRRCVCQTCTLFVAACSIAEWRTASDRRPCANFWIPVRLQVTVLSSRRGGWAYSAPCSVPLTIRLSSPVRSLAWARFRSTPVLMLSTQLVQGAS